MWLFILVSLLTPIEQCNSTIFGYKGDEYAGGNALYLRRPVDPEHDIGIAHRTLPLGSMVLLHVPKNNTWTAAVVIDRGPYGRTDAEGNWYNGAIEWKKGRRFRKGSRWNGCVDLTPKAAKLLKHDGWEKIVVYRIPGVRVDRYEESEYLAPRGNT